MTQEEKAKAYDEALERAKEYWETDNDNTLDIKAKGTMEYLFPELKESEDERMKKTIIHALRGDVILNKKQATRAIAWLEKQGEQRPSQEIEPFEAEHGKYYYCIKDFFCGGRKHASKGDVVQALNEYINWLKSLKERVQPQPKQEWSEEDEVKINRIVACLENLNVADNDILLKDIDWLKSLKQRIV